MENIPNLPSADINFLNKEPGFIMKLVLMIIMIMVVVFFIRIGIALVFYFNSPSKSPYLIDGMIPGNEGRRIQQNPEFTNSITIHRSNNEMSGMEFTWSLWLWIRSGESNFQPNIQESIWRHIFHKGNNSIIGINDMQRKIDVDGTNITRLDTDGTGAYNAIQDNDSGTSKYKYTTKDFNGEYMMNYDYGYEEGMAWPNNSPGLYLDKKNNALRFIMSTYPMNTDGGMITSHLADGSANMVVHDVDNYYVSNDNVQIKEEIDISNIPLDKWVCVVLRVKNNVIDCYINGTITNRHYPLGIIKQNTYDVYTGQNGGFDGYISALKYDNKALSAVDIQNLYKKGPKTKMVSSNVQPKLGKISNLSNIWYGN